MLTIREKSMPLDVELEMLIDGHTHGGTLTAKGDIIRTNPDRAARMIAQGHAKKVGVHDPKDETQVVEEATEEEPEVEAEEAEVEVPEDDED